MNRQPISLDLAALPVNSMVSYDALSAEQQGESVDLAAVLRQVWAAVYRNRLLIVAIIGAMLLAGTGVTILMTPKFKASASLQVDQQTSKVLGTEETDSAGQMQDADRFLQTQVDVMQSRGLTEQVASSLRLDRSDDFVVAMGGKPAAEPSGRLSLRASKHEQVLKTLADNLSVTLPRNSRVVTLSFESPDPALAARVVNSFATNFIMLNLKRKYDQSAYARDFLAQQLGGAKQRLEASERAMLDYSRSVGLIDASAGIGTSDGGSSTNGPRSLVTSDLVSINTSYSQAQAARVQAQQRWQQAQSTPLMNLPEVLANPAITQLSQLRAQVQASYDQDATRHKADYPGLQQLAAQLAAFDGQIAKLANSIKDSIHDQYRTAVRQEQALSGSVSQLKRDTLSEQDKSVRYNILKRETDTNRTMYDGLLQRYKEVSAEAGITTNNISMVDSASVPVKPVSPRAILNLAAALLLGMMLAGVVVLIREKFDDAIRSPEDVPNKLGLPLLNTAPILRAGETPEEALAAPRSALSEAYAALRTSLQLVDGNGLPHSMLFTSSRAGEGKSTSAYAIAHEFAKLGKSVVLIDSDLRRPSLHRVFGGYNGVGLTNVLAGHKTLDEALQKTTTANLTFMPTGPLPPSPAQLLSGALLTDMLATLRERFDLIIIDGPPVLGLADAVLLAVRVERTVFVIEANGAHHGHAKAAIRRLQAAGAAVLGALLTKYDARKAGYGYSYGYYSYSYGAERQDVEQESASA